LDIAREKAPWCSEWSLSNGTREALAWRARISSLAVIAAWLVAGDGGRDWVSDLGDGARAICKCRCVLDRSGCQVSVWSAGSACSVWKRKADEKELINGSWERVAFLNLVELSQPPHFM
jgi:hypothetical protein